MENRQSNSITYILIGLLAVMGMLVAGQYLAARRELESARARCYATHDKDFCDRVL